MIRALIVDDHSIVRAGLSALLAGMPDMQTVTEARTADEALEQLRKSEFDVMLLDLDLPGKSGFEVLRAVRRHNTKLPILIVSMLPEDKHASRLLRTGANGYIMKDCEDEELIKAIRIVAGGRMYVSPRFAEKLILQDQDGVADLPHTSLSDREYEVFSFLVAGKPLFEIASRLHISDKTVGTHRSHILEKMNMTSNAELVKYAVLNGLI